MIVRRLVVGSMIAIIASALLGGALVAVAPAVDTSQEEQLALARFMVPMFAAVTLCTVLVAAFVVRRLSRGHRAIAEAARHVLDGALDARVRLDSSRPWVDQTAHDLNRIFDHLGHLHGIQQRFAANAAQALRSPLAALHSELSHALRRARDPMEYERVAREALDTTTRLRRLVEDLLHIAQVAATPGEFAEPVILEELASEAIAIIAPEARARGVSVDWQGMAGYTAGRPRDLARLLRNLIENAVRHSPRGGHVELECLHVEQRIQIVVQDMGPGVPCAERERIFEAFYRGPLERASHQGAGLGLTLAREIARAHEGDLVATSAQSGAGGCFVVTLPLAGPEPAPKRSTQRAGNRQCRGPLERR